MGTILLVDDNMDALLVVGAGLEDGGFEVITARSAVEVYSSLEAHPIDLVILDLMMPETGGLEILQELRASASWKNLPVIILSALDQGEDRVEALRLGADDYLSKPAQIEELRMRIGRLLYRNHGKGFEGDLQSLSMPQVLQNLAQSSKTGILKITESGSMSRVYIDEGTIIGAKSRKLKDWDALYHLIGLSKGRFHFSERALPEPIDPLSTSISLQTSLLDHALFEDELARRAPLVPGPDQPLKAHGKLDAEFARQKQTVPLAEMFQAVLKEPGVTLRQLTERGLAAPIRLSLASAMLLEGEYLEIGEDTPKGEEPEKKPSAKVPEGPPDEVLQRRIQSVQKLYGSSRLETSLHLLVLFQEEAWPGLLTLLRSVPEHYFLSSSDKLLGQLESLKRGTVRLRRSGSSDIFLNIQEVDTRRQQGAALFQHAAGAMVWLADDTLAETVAGLIDRLRGAPKFTHGMVLATEGDFPLTSNVVDASENWFMYPQPPKDLRDLMGLLASRFEERSPV